MSEYVLASDTDDAEKRRMELLFAYHGALTIEALEASQVSRGWRCLEIGAGGGDITRWLADRVAPNGYRRRGRSGNALGRATRGRGG